MLQVCSRLGPDTVSKLGHANSSCCRTCNSDGWHSEVPASESAGALAPRLTRCSSTCCAQGPSLRATAGLLRGSSKRPVRDSPSEPAARTPSPTGFSGCRNIQRTSRQWVSVGEPQRPQPTAGSMTVYDSCISMTAFVRAQRRAEAPLRRSPLNGDQVPPYAWTSTAMLPSRVARGSKQEFNAQESRIAAGVYT